MIICVIGDLSDLTLVYVAWFARKMGMDVLELDEGALGSAWEMNFDTANPSEGRLLRGGREFSFDELGGAYVRLCPEPKLPPGLHLDREKEFCFKAERRFGVHALLESLPCPVANRPSAGRANGSKPLQMAQLQRAGFVIPAWIVSNDPSAVKRFVADHHGAAIYKAASGARARVRKVDEELSRRLADGTTPIIVQEYIEGVDVRVHTVGEETFATRISGGAGVDYRFEATGAKYEATGLPESIRDRCVTVAKSEGLTIAGFDFRVTTDGRWYCLEVNPVPTFLPYEMCTGQPIAAALLKEITTPGCAGSLRETASACVR